MENNEIYFVASVARLDMRTTSQKEIIELAKKYKISKFEALNIHNKIKKKYVQNNRNGGK